MKKLLYSLIIMIAAICACQDENSELGKSLVDSSFYNIYVDTCTVMSVTENDISLYGFATEEQQSCFELLTAVSGEIGRAHV